MTAASCPHCNGSDIGEGISVYISRTFTIPACISYKSDFTPSASHSSCIHSLRVSRIKGCSFSRTTCSKSSALLRRCIHKGCLPFPFTPIISARPLLYRNAMLKTGVTGSIISNCLTAVSGFIICSTPFGNTLLP